MGTASAKAFGDMILMNKAIQTLDVSDNGLARPSVGDQVKIKSSGELKVVTIVWGDGDVKLQGSDSNIKTSEFEWVSQVPALCAGVAASPSLLSVSTISRHALAVSFSHSSLFPTMYVAQCILE
jgi:hypothetical protein